MSKDRVKAFRSVFLKEARPIDRSGDIPRRSDLAHGFCFYYAYVFKKVLGGKLCTHQVKIKGGYSGHAFVFYKGRYYDGDTIEGVKNWKDLQGDYSALDKNYTEEKAEAFLKRWWIKDEKKIFDKVVKNIKEKHRP